jgi:hypothetical protein
VSKDDSRPKPGQPLRLPSFHTPHGRSQTPPKRLSSHSDPPLERAPQQHTPASGKSQFRSPGASQSGGGSSNIDRDRLAARHASPQEWNDSRPRDESFEYSTARRYEDDDWEDSDRQPAQQDPWDRDWANWSSDHDSFIDDEEDWFSLKRDAWGARANEYTAASVALTVAPNGSPKAGASGKEMKAWPQIARWVRSGFARSARPTKRVMNLVLATTILGTILLSALGLGGAAYLDYESLKNQADSGLSALEHVTADLGIGSKTGGQQVTQAQIAQAARDINLALSDFQQIHDRLANPDLFLSLASHVHSLRDKLQSALLLSQAAIDVANMMPILLPALVGMANVINTSPFSTTATTDNSPLIDTRGFAEIEYALQEVSVSPYLSDLLGLFQHNSPSVLFSALSTSQQEKIGKYLFVIPQLRTDLSFLNSFMPYAEQILDINPPGVNKPVAYLLLTLDNSEIRPVGGFQGQYAVFSVNGGRIGHISLEDIYKYLEPRLYGTVYAGTSAPPPPEDGWINASGLAYALRNSGVSPDFPQSARDALVALQGDNFTYNGVQYTGADRVPNVDSSGNITSFSQQEATMAGVIMFQPKVIQQLIALTGPLRIGCPYDVTVTPQNLETYIHQSQETAEGRKQSLNTPSSCHTSTSGSTKLFTSLLSQALQQEVKSMPKDRLITFVTEVLSDLRTKDVEAYFDNTKQDNSLASQPDPYSRFQPNVALENYLAQHDSSGALYTGPQDSLAVNQANVIGDKVDQFLSMQWVDNITIDSSGGATHTLTLNYNWNIPPIKVPYPPGVSNQDDQANQQAIYNIIFDAEYQQYYQEYRRVYVNGNAQFLGDDSGISSDPYGDLASDVPGLRMFSDLYKYILTINPDQTVSWTVQGAANPTISWYVPNVVAKGGIYVLHLEPQSGMPTSVDITITPPSCAKSQTSFVYNKPLPTDYTITLTFPGCHFP